MRVLPAGAWINSRDVTILAHVSSPASAAQLQPEIELRPVGRAFTGQPTHLGAIMTYRGAALGVRIHLFGLRDGVAYHWQMRVHDLRGIDSAWVRPAPGNGPDLRVGLGTPPPPDVIVAGQPSGDSWLPTRRLTFRWSAPFDPSGIRGYAYTLGRSPNTEPLLRWRTGGQQVTVTARGDGLWYFAVRALSAAHTWGHLRRVAIRIDTAVPRVQMLSSARGPLNPGRTGSLARMQYSAWSQVSVAILSPRGQPVYATTTLMHGPGTIASVRWNGRTPSGQLAANGRYVMRISAVGRSGLRWQTQRPLEVLTTAPAVSSSGLSQPYVYNPFNNALDGTEVVTLSLSAPARVRLEALFNGHVVRSWTLHAPTADSVISATWDGTIARHLAPEGSYSFRAVATDAAGNMSRSTLGTIALDLRRIIVSLDAQQLWELDGNNILLTTLVTTGGPVAPTPVGDFQIIDRESPFTFRSPYPKGSFMWYPPSPTTFALLFQINGYFLHDAPWRSNFGPGSNAVAGKPGGDVTGTHGCVNVPYNYMAWLYNWASMYTPVEIRNVVVPGKWPRPLA